jgi:hypothetical protein
MRRRTVGFMCSAIFGLLAVSSHAMAQQKTIRACQEEWRANKAANQANGITEKAYVAECRGGGVTAAPKAAAPAPSAAAPGPTQTPTSQKTVRACRDEWRANKAANQANGVTERAYIEQCRAGGVPVQQTAAPAAPAPAPTAAPAAPAPAPTAAPAAPAPTPTAAAPPTRPVPAPTSAARSVGANQFSTEAQAKARCPSDTVVWVNLNSKIYHFSGTKSYGTTKNGAYMCEKETAGEGMRAAKNEKHP